MTLSTKIFSLAPGVYSRQTLQALLSRYLWVFIVPLIVFAALGFIFTDAWWWVALIYTFLIIPLFVFFAYFAATLNRLAVDAVKPHSIFMTDAGIIYKEYEVKAAGDAKMPAKKRPVTVYREDAGIEMAVKREVVYTDDEVADIRAEGGWIKIILRKEAGTILIPVEATAEK